MPHEDRRIFFTYEEVHEALTAFATKRGTERPPQGHIVTVTQSDDLQTSIDCVFENHVTNRLENRLYTKDVVSAALMLYCRDHRVPLPKAANKLLEIGKDRLILRAQILH